MRILGATADDKGQQLEQLVRTILEGQGYEDVRCNVPRAGGNELDLVAVRRTAVVGKVHEVPLMGEAKAYADPLTMPKWQTFLGKLLIERAARKNTIGLLIALNGVNGPVAGSATALQEDDTSLFVIDGGDLVKHALEAKQITDEAAVVVLAAEQFDRQPTNTDIAYYDGKFYWLLFWGNEEYSAVAGDGVVLLAEDIEKLRTACEGAISGTLLAADEMRAEAEARHHARLAVMNALFAGRAVPIEPQAGDAEAVASPAEEPFTRKRDGRLTLAGPGDLDTHAISRLFVSIYEYRVKVGLLGFMALGQHMPYVKRLVELLPDVQAGFRVDAEQAESLTQVAALFPSVQALLARPIPLITTHRGDVDIQIDDAMELSDQETFWEEVSNAVRRDYGNIALSGFLYDHLGVAELEIHTEVVVKTKSGTVGQPIRTATRLAVRQYTDDSIGDDAVYIMIKIITGRPQPWEDDHPDAAFPLEACW